MAQGRTARAGILEGSWERAFSNCSSEHLFRIASDIEAYPSFIPGCVATRILKRNADSAWIVDNIFGFGPIRTRFLTKAVLDRPSQLKISSNDGPWKSFSLVWTFTEAKDHTLVACRFVVEFRSDILNKMALVCVHEIERQVLSAFEKRVSAELAWQGGS